MRIGILTFCNAYNLGAALQATSLQKTLENMGHDVELIDYRSPSIEGMPKLRSVFKAGISMKARICKLLYYFVFFPRRMRYKRFQKLAKRSNPYSPRTIGTANDKYDVFITGSDQVFNLELTGNDSTYFLDFVKNGKKASYAASLGVYLNDKKEQYQNMLQSFDYLSVRESSTAKIFEQELGITAEVMPDPVFLHAGDEWRKLLGIMEKKKEKYVLVYSLFEDKELYNIANRVANEKGLKTYVITKTLRTKGKADKFLRNVGPREFVELMASAEYVVTNSFHGTAFSLVFKRPFTVLLPPVAQDRILDLLKAMEAENSRATTENGVIYNIVDYSMIDSTITNMKKQGIGFLNKLLN